MKRSAQLYLDQWINAHERKPLILRGARQVGKTWLVRDLADRYKKDLIELNFERDPSYRRFFLSNDPQIILDEISLGIGRSIVPERSLLFLDEIQAAGELLAKCRWFAEEMPHLPLIAAGSLLEFVLTQHSFSIPVGRVGFLHIEPMIFPEFLTAHGQNLILEGLDSWKYGREFSPVLHEQASTWFHRYCMVGGMPGIVASDVAGSGARKIRELQHDLAATYRADFSKYRKNDKNGLLDATLNAVIGSLGKKFVFAHVREGVKQHHARNALELLAQARICHIVKHSSANGIPLGAEIKDSFRKVILNDIGLFHALQQSPIHDAFPRWENISPQVRGQIIEQVVGQHLRLLGPLSGDGPGLYYWQREGGRPGEVDYLIQLNRGIIPVELKSGAAGSMKSLHQFMNEKKLTYALRFDQNPPSQFDLSLKTTMGAPVHYRLRSLPWYLAGSGPEVLSDR
ncbi:MAG: ATP-binding protein [Chitinispirillaceae bacterium]|nr:ATP-binding protein [Chitinispirillaceae bacterium]